MINRILLALTLLFAGFCVHAQEAEKQERDIQYVTDQLRLSLYARADAQSQVLKLLQSGDQLEIEQISGAYALVTAPDGTRGWVKRGFLVTKPTSNLLLLEEQEKTTALQAEIEKFANSKVVIDQYEKDMDELVGKIEGLEQEKQQATESISELQRELEEKQRELERKEEGAGPVLLILWDTLKQYWEFIVPIILVIIFLSFLISKEIVEARIKAKFHGIKIW